MKKQSKNYLDSELKNLWSEGLSDDRAEEVLSAVNSLKTEEPSPGHKQRIKMIAEKKTGWKFFGVPASAFAMVLLVVVLFDFANRPLEQVISRAPAIQKSVSFDSSTDTEDSEILVTEIFDEELLMIEEVI